MMPKDIINIAKHCSLTTIHIRRMGFFDLEQCKKIVMKSPTIRQLNLCVKTSILCTVAKHCPLAEEIVLARKDPDFDLNLVVEAILSMPKLTYLQCKQELVYQMTENGRRFEAHWDYEIDNLTTVLAKIRPAALQMDRLPISPEMFQILIQECREVLTDLTINISKLNQDDIVKLLRECLQLIRLAFTDWGRTSMNFGAVFTIPNNISTLAFISMATSVWPQ